MLLVLLVAPPLEAVTMLVLLFGRLMSEFVPAFAPVLANGPVAWVPAVDSRPSEPSSTIEFAAFVPGWPGVGAEGEAILEISPDGSSSGNLNLRPNANG